MTWRTHARQSRKRAAGSFGRLLCCAALSLAGSAWSHDASAQTESAARHFDAALEMVDRGELEGAVAEFERAYELRPHYSVLYNLAQVYSRLGRHLEAVDAFERYLSEGGSELDAARRSRVQSLVEEQKSKLATLSFQVTPENAQISIDGARAQLDEGRLSVDPKVHTLGVTAPGYEPHEQRIELDSGEQRRISVDLRPRTRSFELQIHCVLPDVVLEVDGRQVRKLPGGPGRITEKVSAQTPEVRLSREGYEPRRLELDPAVSQHRITCDLEPVLDDRLSLATLNLGVSEPGARVQIDGKAYRGEPLVFGRHLVTVERRGFRRWSSFVSLAPGETAALRVRLTPTDEYRARYEREANSQRTYAFALGALGLAFGVTGGALYAWGFDRQDEYETKRAIIRGSGGGGAGSPEDRENQELRESIVLYDRIALGLGILGAAAVGGSIWLYVDGDDPDRYDPQGMWSVEASLDSVRLNYLF